MSILMFIHFILQMITGLHFDAPVAPPVAVVAPAPQHHVTTPAPVVTPTPTPAPVVEQPQVSEETTNPVDDSVAGDKDDLTAPYCVIDDATGNEICTAPETDCLYIEEWQGEFGCVAVQKPEETDGRQY